MCERYHVIITKTALRHLEETADYIHQDSPQNADLVAEAIVKSIDSLASMPALSSKSGPAGSVAQLCTQWW